MGISFAPMRQLFKEGPHNYYTLGNLGINAKVLHRIRHDQSITTESLGKICAIMERQPGELIEYIPDCPGEDK